MEAIVATIMQCSDTAFPMLMNSWRTSFENYQDEMTSFDQEIYRFFELKNQNEKKVKVNGYVNVVVPRYSDFAFKSHFRVSRDTVELLLERIPNPKSLNPRRPRLPLVDRVLMFLWIMGNHETYREVADRFGVSIGHCHSEFTFICQALANLKRDIIKWPTPTDIPHVMDGFLKLKAISFPGVIGCIDGTHMAMVTYTARSPEKSYYINRKQIASVTLQAVCDSKLLFTDVAASRPESPHDPQVFWQSPLLQRLESGTLNMPSNGHLLGDCDYPLTSKLLTPYHDDGHLSNKQKCYNQILRSTRVVIEQAFGQLFGRFRKLKHLQKIRKDYLLDVIIAACVLHNLCVMHKDIAPEIDSSIASQLLSKNAANVQGMNSPDGCTKRDEIADHLFETTEGIDLIDENLLHMRNSS